jgi:glycosyltransferase involved in cell wall biosynthesis
MKLLFLSKRHPQGRDLITRPYGRFHFLPHLLAGNGAQCLTILGNYKDEPEISTEVGNVQVHSLRVFPNTLRFRNKAMELGRAFQPDAVIGFSDTWFGILAARISRQTGSRLIIDAYDNYEAYIPAAKPLHWLWRRSLRQADALSAAGPQLLELLRESNPYAGNAVVPMCADPIFRPQASISARLSLGLPEDRKLVGYLGTADPTRGFDLFETAISGLMKQRQDFDVVISGRSDFELGLPQERVHRLGYISDQLMPALNSSCDLLLCLNRDSPFGRYSYPVKIYESLACRRPVLASDTAPARWILGGEERCLARLENADDLGKKLDALLDNPIVLPEHPGWEYSAAIFQSLLEGL